MGGLVDAIESAWDALVDVVNATIAVVFTATGLGIMLSQVSDDFKDWYVSALAPVMSLFGITEEDIISVQVIDQPLFSTSDPRRDAFVNMAISKARNDSSTIENFIKFIFPFDLNANSYYRVGANGSYYNLLPDATISSIRVPLLVKDYIASEFNVSTVNILDGKVKGLEKEEWVYYLLARDYGYRVLTNTYTTSEILYDMGNPETVTYTWTVNNIDYQYDEFAGDSYVVYSSRTEDNVTYNTSITLPAFNLTLYYMVKWYTIDPANYNYWCYDIGSGEYAALDQVENSKVSTTTTMLPVVELRNNFTTITPDDGEVYKDTRFILSKVGLSLPTMLDSLEANPDIADIESAYIYFGLDMKDTSEVGAKYIFHTFKSLIDQQTLTDDQLATYYTSETSSYGNNTFYMTEGNYNTTMIWKEQYYYKKLGSLKSKGTYWSEVNELDSSITLRYQKTLVQYDEIVIKGIAGTTIIKAGGMAKTTVSTLGTDSTLIMPLSLETLRTLDVIDMLELYTKTLRMAIYAAEITHLEWYQTEAFFDLIGVAVKIIGIVLFILTLPAGGSGGTAWIAFAETLLYVAAITIAAKYLIEYTDNPYLKAAIAVAASITASYVAGGFKFPDLSFTNAQSMLMVVNGFSTAVSTYTNAKMEDLQKSMKEFSDIFTNAMTELEEKMHKFEKLLSTEEVVQLTAITATPGYIQGYDAKMYIALGGPQYNYSALCGTQKLNSLYDYDLAFKVGML